MGSRKRQGTRLAACALALGMLFACGAGAPAANADAPAATDVLLILDTTASMETALAAAKAEIETSVNQINSDLPNVHYAVAQVRDYQNVYGEPGDTPWELVQPMTDDTASVVNAVGGLHASGGGTAPESYARALWEGRLGGSVGWRPQAKHVIVLVGDAFPHDDDLDQGIPSADWIVGSPWNTGTDPGPDETVGTPDDLDWQTVLSQLASDETPLMFLFYRGTDPMLPYWDSWTAATGGLMENGGSGQLPTDLVYLVERGAGLPPCIDPSDSPPCAEAPHDHTTNWKGKRGSVELDRAAADRVPFQVRVTGAVDATADLLDPTTATLSTDPNRTLEIAGPLAPTATFALATGRFGDAPGVSSSPPSMTMNLAWPDSATDRGAALSLYTLASHSSYSRNFAHVQLDATVQGSLSTSVGVMATWAETHRWLGRVGRGSALAWWLTQYANRVPSGWGTPLQFDALTPMLRGFIARARELAGNIKPQRPAAKAPALRASVLSRGRRLGRSMPAWRANVPAQFASSPSDGAGLRRELGVMPAGRKALRHGSWRRVRALASRASASLLGMPLASRQQPLWVSARRVRAGHPVTVLASGLRGARELGVTIVGPAYSAEARLRARAGTAAATLLLPPDLPAGRYWVGVLDFSRLDAASGPVRIASTAISVRP
jgi:hypothetical protein